MRSIANSMKDRLVSAARDAIKELARDAMEGIGGSAACRPAWRLSAPGGPGVFL